MQGFAADLFTTLHCPTALVVRTQDQPLAAEQMKLLEEGASVIEWIAIVRPSSKNRALAAGTRRLVATARTHYLSFGTVKIEPIHHIHPGPYRQSSNSSITNPPGPHRNGSWGSNFAHTQHQSQTVFSTQHPRVDTSPSNSSLLDSGNGFDWSSFPMFSNTQNAQAIATNQPHMQTLPVGQISPMDLTVPLSSPTQGMSLPTQTPTFGHLPMMPNQMDNWPMSMQNLGQLEFELPAGTTLAPDPYAPSSEGFDMWLASILADNNGDQGSFGQGGHQ